MSASINTSENELAAIRQELNELRQTVAGMRSNGHSNGNGASFLEAAESSALTDRRGMLKKVAGLQVGVATVGLLRPSGSKAATGRGGFSKTGVPSATGGNFILGMDNNAGAFTGLFNTTTALLDTQLRIRNYGLTDFVPPGGTNIAVVGYCDDESSTASGDMVGHWGECRSVLGGRATGVAGFGNSIGGTGVGG
jgi:hypothetical protein